MTEVKSFWLIQLSYFNKIKNNLDKSDLSLF